MFTRSEVYQELLDSLNKVIVEESNLKMLNFEKDQLLKRLEYLELVSFSNSVSVSFIENIQSKIDLFRQVHNLNKKITLSLYEWRLICTRLVQISHKVDLYKDLEFKNFKATFYDIFYATQKTLPDYYNDLLIKIATDNIVFVKI